VKAGKESKYPCSVCGVRLRIRRLGGIAGVTLKSEIDTDEMPAERAKSVEAAVGELAGHTPAGPPRPDGFRYEITAPEEPDSAPIVLNEGEIPEHLRGAIEEAAGSAQPERRERPGTD
jgi:hypothetical protein